MESLIRMLHYIQKGEFWIFPILTVMAVGFAISIERYVYLTLSKIRNRSLLSKILPLLQRGDLKQVYNLAVKSDVAIGRMVSHGLSRYKISHSRDDVEMAMEESMMEIIPRLEKRTQYVATFANVATLLGLLGTVMGLIGAFAGIGDIDPAQKAKALSSNISLAMNTTAMGLIAAIPLTLIHTVLQSKTTEIIDSLEMATVKLTNIVMQRKSKSSSSSSTTDSDNLDS